MIKKRKKQDYSCRKQIKRKVEFSKEMMRIQKRLISIFFVFLLILCGCKLIFFCQRIKCVYLWQSTGFNPQIAFLYKFQIVIKSQHLLLTLHKKIIRQIDVKIDRQNQRVRYKNRYKNIQLNRQIKEYIDIYM